MRIICAPDSFKGSISAIEAAEAIKRGIVRALPDVEVDLCPMADGGEGTVAAMLHAAQATSDLVEWRKDQVMGPLGDLVEAPWGLFGGDKNIPRTAVIEMAAASGLMLVPENQRDPERTTTFGTGQLIRLAIDAGAQRVILGIGGSATCDGGGGMAQAIGVLFLDAKDGLLLMPLTGGTLDHVAHIVAENPAKLLDGAKVIAACDVDNPLTGPNGAAAIYGPQKGATPDQVERLDKNLGHLADLIRKDLSVDIETMAGAGAAGGLGAGLAAFLDAPLQPGAPLVLDALGFDQRVAQCDLCITGEGRLDGQTLSGKVVMAVTNAAARHGVPTVALVGTTAPDADKAIEAGLHAYYEIGKGIPIQQSMEQAGQLLEEEAAKLPQIIEK